MDGRVLAGYRSNDADTCSQIHTQKNNTSMSTYMWMNLLRIFSLVLERCTHCGRNSSTDCNGLLRFYSLVWGYKVSLSTFMRDISRHLGFMGCGLLVHYYIPKGVVVVQYAVYSPDIFLILHLLFPDFLCISTMRTKTKYCKKSFKRLPRFRLSKGDFL